MSTYVGFNADFFTTAPKCTTQFHWPGSLPDHLDTEAELGMFSMFGRQARAPQKWAHGPENVGQQNSESHISNQVLAAKVRRLQL